jgi:hypothetical protein
MTAELIRRLREQAEQADRNFREDILLLLRLPRTLSVERLADGPVPPP